MRNRSKLAAKGTFLLILLCTPGYELGAAEIAPEARSCPAVFESKPQNRDWAEHIPGAARFNLLGLKQNVVLAMPQAELNQTALFFSVFVNGVETAQTYPWKTDELVLSEPEHGQIDYYIAVNKSRLTPVGNKKQRFQQIAISELNIRESFDSQNIGPKSFSSMLSKQRMLKVSLSESLKSQGLDASLTSRAIELGYEKIVWVLKRGAPASIKAFIDNCGNDLKVKAVIDAKGAVRKFEFRNLRTGKTLSATPEEVYAKLDAAFNGDVFSWDDMLVALGTIAVHPWLVKSTIEFWLDVQKMNGGAIPREVRKSNLLSLWFADIVRPGEKTKPNLNYANPYLMNWVAERLYAYDPSPENAKLLLRVVKSIADYSKWMKKTRSVYDSEGKFLGFSTNALASGLDNSRGGRGNDHAPEAYQTAWVDTLAQHVAMLKSVVRWNEMFIEKDLPKLSAKYIELIKDEIKSDETLLNTKYYDKDLKFHFDLIPDGKGGHRRDTAYHSIAGFFPFFSASVSPEQAREIVALQLSPERFGGTFPLPANSRHAIRLEENNDGYWHLDARWPSMAVIVVEGLKRSGMRQAAFDMAVGFLKGMTEASTKTVYEFYGLLNKLSDSGQKGRPGQESGHTTRVDFAGWGKVPPIYMMLETVIGLEPQFNGELHWNVMFKMESGEKVEVANYMYRGRLIKKLTLRKTESGKLVVDIDQGNSLGPGASDGPIDIKIFDLYSGN